MLNRTMLVMLATATMLTPAVWAGHDDDRFLPPNRTVVLADDLLDATRHMQRVIDQRRGRRGHTRDLLFALNRLENQTRRFRIDVVRGVAPRHLNAELDVLLTAFNRTDREMRFVRSEPLQRDFRCVKRAVRSLARDIEIASAGPTYRRRAVPRGEIVIGNRGRDSRFQFRIGF